MPISNLHDEILQITFEFGTLLQQQDQPHFGSLVSHVTRRWRRTALATPLLWTKILFEKNPYGSAYPERQIDRAAAFLARSMPLPVDVDIEGVEEEDFDHSDDAAPAFLQLIIIHIGRCRRLNITDGDRQGMAVINILTYIPFQAAPILNSIKVGHNYDETWGPKRPLFQLGAPHLMTADIEGISIPSIPDFLSNLQHLTSLRISVTFNQDIPGATYNKLRDSLMALPSLNHLDLTIHDIFMDMEPRLPIILPTLHFLQLDGDVGSY
ncbi:hypothetical protein FIBSPDRAFT_74972 [Athelia psychrophila]|uniref:F-box domain-containing protein n=1 Tax=Athelia psychrophila TaxID=1759441 RepID=A0A166EJI3_9AGAM|nr:hypothetical protein FIBSPDRAFT_74972 [Fibularhizoctonia sp. CBS 109695]